MDINKAKIELIMAKKTWTGQDLANVYGVTKARMNKILNSRAVRPCTAGKLAKALGVDVTEIIDM